VWKEINLMTEQLSSKKKNNNKNQGIYEKQNNRTQGHAALLQHALQILYYTINTKTEVQY
jgi:hypothetical protein